MISKQDILNRAAQWQLRPAVVEKDYILGWLLSGVAQHPIIGKEWIFKGGTCIKKCYFETYRFSEDLDFSLSQKAPYTEAFILSEINEILESVSSASGISFATDQTTVEGKINKQNQPTFKAKITYSGPLVMPGTPKILFDITNNEPLFSAPVKKTILHAYPDNIPPDALVAAYSLEELLAEKTRALYERTRPRDLYDVVYILLNKDNDINYSLLREIFIKKCESKSIQVPSSKELLDLINSSAELKADWDAMLSHQLPGLPTVEDYLSRIASLLRWIDESEMAPNAEVLGKASGEGQLVNPQGIQFWPGSTSLEVLRFSGANRLKVKFDYNDKQDRIIEPYSLRRAATGNLLLYGWQDGETHIKAFIVDKIQNLTSTNISFMPKFQVEF